MLRFMVGSLSALLVAAGLSLAADKTVKGTVKKVNDDGTITVSVKGKKDQQVKVATGTKVIGADGKDLAGGVKGLKAKDKVTVVSDAESKAVKSVTVAAAKKKEEKPKKEEKKDPKKEEKKKDPKKEEKKDPKKDPKKEEKKDPKKEEKKDPKKEEKKKDAAKPAAAPAPAK
jgi:hypothetical protein